MGFMGHSLGLPCWQQADRCNSWASATRQEKRVGSLLKSTPMFAQRAAVWGLCYMLLSCISALQDALAAAPADKEVQQQLVQLQLELDTCKADLATRQQQLQQAEQARSAAIAALDAAQEQLADAARQQQARQDEVRDLTQQLDSARSAVEVRHRGLMHRNTPYPCRISVWCSAGET